MKKTIKKSTKRLIIRPLELRDYEAWKSTFSNLKTPQNVWDIGPLSKEDLKLSFFKKVIKGRGSNYYEFGVFLKNGTLIGKISLMDISRGLFQSAYLGYQIYNLYWNQGYASEALRALIEIGFYELNLHRIEAGIEPHNKRSIRVAKALQMRKEGLKKNALYIRGKWVSISMYTLTCEDIGLEYKFQTQLSYF